ncbi:MAG: transporter substrate-binding domain-containing protein [Promethearchaeota archaeon]
MKGKKILISMLFLALLVPALISPVKADDSLAAIQSAGEIIVACEAAYPPFEQRDPETDEIEGFDIDIMEYVADELGVNVTWMDVSWDTIFTGLAADNYDCIISAVTITATREESMDFTRWYYKSTQAVMVSMDNPAKISSIDDVNSSVIKVGFQAGTTSQWYIEDEGIVAEPVSFATITLAIQALLSGTVDVVLGDYAPLYNGQQANPGEFAIIDTFSPESFGIACKEGATSLVDAMNTALDKILGADEEAPTYSTFYNTTYENWFGVPPATEFATDPVPEGTGGIPGYSALGMIFLIPVVSAILIRKMKK